MRPGLVVADVAGGGDGGGVTPLLLVGGGAEVGHLPQRSLHEQHQVLQLAAALPQPRAHVTSPSVLCLPDVTVVTDVRRVVVVVVVEALKLPDQLGPVMHQLSAQRLALVEVGGGQTSLLHRVAVPLSSIIVIVIIINVVVIIIIITTTTTTTTRSSSSPQS